MKYKLFIMSFLSMALLCGAQNRIDKQGRRQGHWIKTDKDGSKIYEGNFKDGKETGEFRYFYPDGTLKIKNTYTDPGRYCSHEAYDTKGHLIAKGFYNQKNRDSVWQMFNEEGHLVKVASYRMGVKQGTHIVFTSNNDTAEISTWSDNRRDGRWWKRIGSKGWICGHYEKGLMQGALNEYDDAGRPVRQFNYKDGVKHGVCKHYEQGVCTVDEKWDNGSLADRKILLRTPDEKWVSAFGIAYFMPRRADATIVYMNDGTRIDCRETLDNIKERAGHDLFVLISRKSLIYSNISSIVGFSTDEEGRQTLELNPKPSFTVFPDEECIKMVKSLKRIDELD